MRSSLAAAVIIVWTQSWQANAENVCASDADSAARISTATHQRPSSNKTLEEWLDALSFAESGNRARIIHQDLDGRNYYGCLQFRLKTFRFFVDKFGLAPNLTATDVTNLIYDCAFQKRLAAFMILDNPASWKHWRKTVQRIGLPPSVTDAAAAARSARAARSCPADKATGLRSNEFDE